jgi:hypothetical protein
MITYIFLIFSIIIVYLFFYNKIERFDDYNKNLVGYDESMLPEYRQIDYPKTVRQMYNINDYKSNNWHLRFPYMINQRYSYNDKKEESFPTIYDHAYLKELPLDLHNFYYSKIPLQDDKLLNEYQLDLTNQKYKGHEIGYYSQTPFRKNYPYLLDNLYDLHVNRKAIIGYDNL